MTVSAIVLAAGKGRRVGGDTPKQYLKLKGHPLLYYALKAFEESTVDEIVLVVPEGDSEYCREEILRRYGFQKVAEVTEGGEERYDSVYAGLLKAKGDFVLIHDSARALIDEEIIERAVFAVKQYEACAVGMPSKDTVKLVESSPENRIRKTPDRRTVWTVQTPQCFRTALLKEAYDKMYETLSSEERQKITDDAMVVERMTAHPVYMIRGSYENMKITTPEDLPLAALLLEKREEKRKGLPHTS